MTEIVVNQVGSCGSAIVRSESLSLFEWAKDNSDSITKVHSHSKGNVNECRYSKELEEALVRQAIMEGEKARIGSREIRNSAMAGIKTHIKDKEEQKILIRSLDAMYEGHLKTIEELLAKKKKELSS